MNYKIVSPSDRQAVRTVRIDAHMESGIIVVVPLDSESRAVLQSVLDAPTECRGWKFCGSTYKTPGIKDELIGVNYACGGEDVIEREKSRPNYSRHTTHGLVELYFDLWLVTDDDARYAMRDYGFFASTVVKDTSTADRFELVCGKPCKVCGGRLSTFAEVEWKVCNNCSAICEHEYKEGVGQSNGQVAWLPFCRKCGRGDPDWEPNEDPFVDAANTVQEGGLDGLLLRHPDGSSTMITKKK